MKGLIRNTVLNALCLFLLAQIIEGLSITDGFISYLLAGLCLTLLFKILRPILNLISLPLNALTLGLFSVVTNGIIFYLLTVFIPSVQITKFTFHGASWAGFIIPEIYIGAFFAFIVISILQSMLYTVIDWILRK